LKMNHNNKILKTAYKMSVNKKYFPIDL